MKKLLCGVMATFAACVVYWAVTKEESLPKSEGRSEGQVLFPPGLVARQAPLPLLPSPEPVFTRIFAGDKELSAVPADVIGAFLERNRTNAQSLIAVYQVTRDPMWLRLAAEQFPNNPEVLFNAVTHDVFPENRGEWLDKLKAAMPENAVGNYLSAHDHFKNGQHDLAAREMMDARNKAEFHEFTPDKLQSLEELYLAAGKPAAEAKALAMANVLLPHLQQLRELSKQLVAAQAEHITAGDYESARDVALAGLQLGQHLSYGNGAKSLLNQLVGLVIEDEAIKQLPADQWHGQLSVTDYRAAIQQEKTRVREASKMFDEWTATADEARMISYFDRVKLYGEPAALAWLANSLQR